MRKRRILIVDDEPGFNRLLKLTLERTERYDVLDQDDATMAWEAAVEFNPDLVLLDVVMPKLDGVDVARKIRGTSQLRDPPILFLSATVVKKVGEPMEIAGFPALAKPISMLALQNGSIVKIGGHVEADETFIGGKARFMHQGKRKAEGRFLTAIAGMIGKRLTWKKLTGDTDGLPATA